MKEKIETTNSFQGEIATGLSDRMLLHPDDVLVDTSLSNADKRAILAAWASNIRAVKDAPSCRHLDSGAVVEVSDIMRALKSLDGVDEPVKRARRMPNYPRRHDAFLARWRGRLGRRGGSDDDNNQPPPCPAAVRPPARVAEVDVGNRPQWA